MKDEITINGVLYVKVEPKAEKTYKPGDVFEHSSGDKFILANIGNDSISLINLTTGNRWTDLVIVDDTNKITEEEFESITVNQGYKFKKL